MLRRHLLAGVATVAATTGQAAADIDTDLIALTARANTALMKGDAVAYAAVMKMTDDFTLMQPFGGKIVRGFDPSPEHISKLGSFFRNGDFRQDVVKVIRSDNIAVLVLIERQSVEVGGLPKQEWELRVTLVFHKQRGEWRLAHRHADPLVHGVTVSQAAELARGAL
jgi:ketosteroid isomerase-like protein